MMFDYAMTLSHDDGNLLVTCAFEREALMGGNDALETNFPS